MQAGIENRLTRQLGIEVRVPITAAAWRAAHRSDRGCQRNAATARMTAARREMP